MESVSCIGTAKRFVTVSSSPVYYPNLNSSRGVIILAEEHHILVSTTNDKYPKQEKKFKYTAIALNSSKMTSPRVYKLTSDGLELEFTCDRVSQYIHHMIEMKGKSSSEKNMSNHSTSRAALTSVANMRRSNETTVGCKPLVLANNYNSSTIKEKAPILPSIVTAGSSKTASSYFKPSNSKDQDHASSKTVHTLADQPKLNQLPFVQQPLKNTELSTISFQGPSGSTRTAPSTPIATPPSTGRYFDFNTNPMRPSFETPNKDFSSKENSTEALKLSFWIPGSNKSESSSSWVKSGGIRNLGNTCYINSVLQALLCLQGFKDDLSSDVWKFIRRHRNREVKAGNGASPLKGSCSYHFQKVIEWSNARDSVLDPSIFKRALDATTNRYVGYSQQDAHEFFGDLIDCLHGEMEAIVKDLLKQIDTSQSLDSRDEELLHKRTRIMNNEDGTSLDNMDTNTPSHATAAVGVEDTIAKVSHHVNSIAIGTPKVGVTTSESDSGSDSSLVVDELLPTSRRFHSVLEVTFTCTSCGYCRSKKETYRDFSLIIDSESASESLQSLISTFFAAEQRSLTCEKCQGADAKVTSVITSLPNVLVIHLKRFILNEKLNKWQKSHRVIDFPDVLDMSSYYKAESTVDTNVNVNRFPVSTSNENHIPPPRPPISMTSTKSGQRKFTLHGVLRKIVKMKNAAQSLLVSGAMGMFSGAKRKVESREEVSLVEDDDLKRALADSLKVSNERICSKCSLHEGGMDIAGCKCELMEEGSVEDEAQASEFTSDDLLQLAPIESVSTHFGLAAVVRHQGSDMSSGHYIADVLLKGVWKRCDDSLVHEISEETVLSDKTDSYILFYERR